jgi:hypothetical protein
MAPLPIGAQPTRSATLLADQPVLVTRLGGLHDINEAGGSLADAARGLDRISELYSKLEQVLNKSLKYACELVT